MTATPPAQVANLLALIDADVPPGHDVVQHALEQRAQQAGARILHPGTQAPIT
jgi:hypothetical protein